MSQWVNDYGISIRMGCMSCKFSEDWDARMTKKQCTIATSEEDETHDKYYACDLWSPRDMYRWIGSSRAANGAMAKQGQVKSKQYLAWLVKNANENWMPFKTLERQELFAKQCPNSPLYYIKI